MADLKLIGGRPAALAVGLVIAVVGLALARIAGGWAALAPDDARYLFVGLSILDGQGAVTPGGDPYLMRSPVYGLALAVGSLVLGGDPLVGARVVALVVSLLALLGAARLGWLVAGPGGGVGAVLALVSTPLIWHLLPSLRIDLPQTALVIALLLVAWRPSVRRWAAAGVVLGLVVLVKETALPLLLLPIALVGSVPVAGVFRMAAAYVGAAVITAGWWWVVVWMASGQVFPANALAVVEARDVGGALRVASSAVPLLLAFVVGWVVVGWRARQELGARLLVVAGIALTPLTVYAAANSLNARNFAGLAVLSCIAAGVAGATIVAAARSALSQPSGSHGSAWGRFRPGAAGLGLGLVLAFALVGPALGQRSVPGVVSDQLADDLVAWLAMNLDDGGRIVMPFREREEVALRRFGSTQVRLLGIQRVDASDPPESFIWMGLRDAQLFGYSRTVWVSALTDPPATYLVLVGPHPFTPVDLVGAGAADPSIPGLTPVSTLEGGGDQAEILHIDPTAVRATTGDVPLHLSAEAALAWLDQAGGGLGAAERLLQARPIVSGKGLAELLAVLGDRVCRMQAPADATQLALAGTCP